MSFNYLDVRFRDLVCREFGRRAHERVPRIARLGEGNNFTDIGLVAQDHNQPIQAGRRTAVRGSCAS